MIAVRRLLAASWPVRWWRSLVALCRHVRLHPTTALFGHTSAIRFGRGCSIGARARFDAGATGRIVLDERVWLSADVELETATAIMIGAGTTVQRRCSINGSTRIGAGCIFAPNVFVSSGTHPFRFIPHLTIREQERRIAASPADAAKADRPVWIQDDCWLGANVVVCPGVTVGKGSVIGANSVVTRDVAPYVVVAGAPARTIGRRLEWSPPDLIDVNNDSHQPYILEGRLVRSAEGQSAYVESNPDVPLRFALSIASSLRELGFEWRAQVPIQFKLGSRVFNLPAGSGWFELPHDALESIGGVLQATITIISTSRFATLRVTRIGIKEIG